MVVIADAVDTFEVLSVTLSTGICVVETVISVLASVANTVVGASSTVSELIGEDVTLLLGVSKVVGTTEVDVSTIGTLDVTSSEEDVDGRDTIDVSDAGGVEVDSACRTLEEEVVASDSEAAGEVADMVVDVVCVAGLVVDLAGDEGAGKLLEESPVDDAGSDLTVDVDSGTNVLREVDTGTDVEKPSVVAVALPSVL